MDAPTPEYLAGVVASARSFFGHIGFVIDTTPERSLLRLQAEYGSFHVFVTELLSQDARKYRYYVLRGDWVEAGFGNSADPRAIRLRYGRIGKDHAGELIPHLHLKDKAQLLLTDEMTFEVFLAWLKTELPAEDELLGS